MMGSGMATDGVLADCLIEQLSHHTATDASVHKGEFGTVTPSEGLPQHSGCAGGRH